MATYSIDDVNTSSLVAGDIINCDYSGTSENIQLPAGTYQLECWGAQGGNGGGYGGYSIGTLNLSSSTTLYAYTGGQGFNFTTSGGFNGGGSIVTANNDGGSGGGASDIRIGQDSLYARVIVAGGGGGIGYQSNGGYGGGTTGGNGILSSGFEASQPGTQTSGGTMAAGGSGSFGTGGIGTKNGSYASAGGGGGWYGGSSGYSDSNGGYAGAGGSGYVYTSSTASNYPSGCLLNSSYYLIDAQTIAGNTSFLSPSGISETGHPGDGYVRITVLSIGSSLNPLNPNYYPSINNTYDIDDDISNLTDGDIINCEYSGSVKQITLPYGAYEFLCWGAQGGDYSTSYKGGKGGYSYGRFFFQEDTTVYLYAGGAGNITTATNSRQNGGFNGGGNAYGSTTSSYRPTTGGGASDVRFGTDSLYARAIVAGGGGGVGGRYHVAQAGAGGGTTGQNCPNYSTSYYGGGGGTQTAGGASYNGTSSTTTAGSFGVGGYQDSYYAGGGGGGWYGGGSGRRSGGGGGSGYVYTSESASNYPTGCLLNSDHYALFGETLDGTETFISPSTTMDFNNPDEFDEETLETGHSGNGYIRIFAIYVPDPNLINIEDVSVVEADFTCIEDYETLMLDPGTYKLECWGAQGGYGRNSSTPGGKGGYTSGYLTLSETATVYVNVGGKGNYATATNTTVTGGYNGGGQSRAANATYYCGSGGGASDIRIGSNSLYSRVIVAGGGGGSGYSNSGGAGGGESGTRGANSGGQPGTQTAAGTANNTSNSTVADFGNGGGSNGTATSNYNIAGGGGGWYGGAGHRAYTTSTRGGGGGSGYVYTSSTAANYPSGCNLNSNYYLTNTQNLDGTQTFPSPLGGTETGHEGDGYIRITLLPPELELQPGNYIPCEYDGEMKHIMLPEGYYKLECWGAQGGDFYFDSQEPLAYGGYGGYSVGYLNLSQATDMYLNVGGQNGYNGGGASLPIQGYYPGCGGGASDIRIGQDSLYSRAIVAGGGGGATFTGGGGSGGVSTTTLFNGTVTCVENDNNNGILFISNGSTIPIVPGAHYIVTYNNTVYEGTGFSEYDGGSFYNNIIQTDQFIVGSGNPDTDVGTYVTGAYDSGISIGATRSLKVEVYNNTTSETILSNSTYTCTNVSQYGSYYANSNANITLVNGYNYTVNINGDIYNCHAWQSGNVVGATGMGLMMYVNTSTNSLDISVWYPSYSSATGQTITVTIQRVMVTPNMTTLYNGTAIFVQSNSYAGVHADSCDLYGAQTTIPIVEGGSYTVTFDGVEIECTGQSNYNYYNTYIITGETNNEFIEIFPVNSYFTGIDNPPYLYILTNKANVSGNTVSLKIEMDSNSIGLHTLLDTSTFTYSRTNNSYIEYVTQSTPSFTLYNGNSYIVTVGNDIYNCHAYSDGYVTDIVSGDSGGNLYFMIENNDYLLATIRTIYGYSAGSTVQVKVQQVVPPGFGDDSFAPTFPFDVIPQYTNEGKGGNGGGITGATGYEGSSSLKAGTGGSQTAAGVSYYGTSSSNANLIQPSFGVGGSCNTSATGITAVGGGGGWYGGGSSGTANDTTYPPGAGGGGSGYVYTSSTASNYPSGCLLNSTYYLKNASTTGQTTRTGNGYIVITVVEEDSINIQIKVDNEWKTVTAVYVKVDGTWKATDGVYIKQNNIWLKSGS